MATEQKYFQDYMPGNTCFGCGSANPHGLHIHSFWQGDKAVCHWQPETHHQGWANLTCGGIIATLVDCHCIATAMATAIRNENRSMDSEPRYLFATGTINLSFLKPSLVSDALQLQAQVTQIKYDKKYTVECDVFANQQKTAHAQGIALLVYRSDKPEQASEHFRLHT